MKTIAIVEIVSAVFLGIILLRLASEKEGLASNKYLRLSVLLCIFSLLVDAAAYIITGPSYPQAVRYVINLFAFEAGTISSFGFTLYIRSFISDKVKINPWVFRGVIIVEIIWFLAVVFEFVTGRFITYTNGIENINYSIPVYLQLMSIVVLFYLSAVILFNRENIGNDITLLFCIFFFTPIIGLLASNVTEYDYSYVFGAITIAFVVEFVQKKQAKEFDLQQAEEQARHQSQLTEALAKAEEEAVLRKMVYEISDSSQWSYGISADDEVISVNYSDRLLNVVKARPSGDAMGWVRLVHPEDKDRVLAGFMAPIYDHSGNTLYDESYRILNDDGNYRWVRSTGRVIRRPDGTGEFVGMATDFTEQIREQEQHQKQLSEALSMADAANKAKTDFLFNMSHDIRTPMNAIIGFTNIAKKEIDNRERALDSLEKVQLSSDILLNLINDVLDMSRIESGKVELHEDKHEIVKVYGSFAPAMANLAAAKNIDLQFSVGEVRDNFVFADGPRFDRVLINIISNAIKYTPAGGFVKVTAEQTEDTNPGYGNYKFTVTDSGIGMSEEFQKHMFEDFTREENSTTSGIQGTGLGLSLAKKITDLMGGKISCVSKQGIGTTFTLTFPFRLQTEEDRLEEKAAVQEFADMNLNGKRVLLVEDNELNREIAGEILSAEGLAVETAIDGQKAVNMARAHTADYYDFILMDVQMPVMDGYEATRMIRKLMPELKSPIIALSANAFEEDKKKSLEAGMDDHVAKPINIKELLGALARFV